VSFRSFGLLDMTDLILSDRLSRVTTLKSGSHEVAA
jgi:hypothetical protein